VELRECIALEQENLHIDTEEWRKITFANLTTTKEGVSAIQP
jgi:hypothetical protein